MQSTLYYIHDPMCSWCWAFRPMLQQLREQTGHRLKHRNLLGGLAPDTDAPMPGQLQQYLQQTWRTIQRQVPGTRFNFGFWTECQPRRSTYPACRAVISARLQGERFEAPMISAIQQAYYLRARNPSDVDTLVALAVEIGLDSGRFAKSLDAAATQDQLEREISQSRSMGVQGFPSLVLELSGRWHPIAHDYIDSASMIRQLVAAGVNL